MAIKAERERNFTATLNNLSIELTKYRVDNVCIMPIEPNVNTSDIIKASEKDNRIIPFGSINFDDKEGLADRVKNKISEGAKGFKLHPIIQRVSMDSERVYQVMEALPSGFTILSHTGVASYYSSADRAKEIPENGAIKPFYNLVKAFPKLNFIAGHAGLKDIDDVIYLLNGLDNVWVDTSFQSPRNIRRLINAFGSEKVLFASDWPYGYYGTAIRCVKVACKKDNALFNKLMGNNAKNLLKL